jgi:glycosyltransferase involved in cell wall biosynthesis
MKYISHSTTLRDWIDNTIRSRGEKPYSTLYYVVESADWVIKQVGTDITKNLNEQDLLKAKATRTYKGIRNQIVHFGSRDLFLPSAYKKMDSSNRTIFTWFHGTEEDSKPANLAMIKSLPEASKRVDIVHTSCTISKENLIRWGVPEDKVVIVPLGVDLNVFKPVSEGERELIRKDLGLPQDKLIIGSFQKDGVGWGEGWEPKWVKGPDIFIEVINKLRLGYDIFVLLTGPARGYVKKELERLDVPYKHFFLKNYLEIPKYYNALDLYLVTSRAEGGPKAIVESMATGVPIVSTRVGMAPDIIEEGYNGLLANIDDAINLTEKAGTLLSDKTLASKLSNNALGSVADYSWENIAREYYKRIYQRVLDK